MRYAVTNDLFALFLAGTGASRASPTAYTLTAIVTAINDTDQLMGNYADAHGVHNFGHTNGVFTVFNGPSVAERRTSPPEILLHRQI